MNSHEPRAGLSIFGISIFQLAIILSFSFYDFYNSIRIFSVDYENRENCLKVSPDRTAIVTGSCDFALRVGLLKTDF